jgi:hypothetical protein
MGHLMEMDCIPKCLIGFVMNILGFLLAHHLLSYFYQPWIHTCLNWFAVVMTVLLWESLRRWCENQLLWLSIAAFTTIFCSAGAYYFTYVPRLLTLKDYIRTNTLTMRTTNVASAEQVTIMETEIEDLTERVDNIYFIQASVGVGTLVCVCIFKYALAG